MKKLLKGCGIIALVLAVLLVGSGIFLWLKVRNASKQMGQLRTDIVALNEKNPFSAPPAGAMEPERLKDFFAVRTGIMKTLENDPVVNKFRGQQKPQIGIGDFTHLIFRLPQTMAAEFKMQLEAKNMSPDEYAWFSRTIYTTIYNGKSQGDRELIPLYDSIDENLRQFNMQIAQMKQQGTKPVSWDSVVSSEINGDEATRTANRNLVIEHKEEILEHPQLAFLEMMFSHSVESLKPVSASIEVKEGS